MKTIFSKYKGVLLIIINIVPFVLNIIFYKFGSMDDLLLFVPVFIVLLGINFCSYDNILHFILIQLLVLACLACSGYLSTYLYYHNVSNDLMTPIIGQYFVFAEAAINVITTIIAVIVKSIKNKKNEANS